MSFVFSPNFQEGDWCLAIPIEPVDGFTCVLWAVTEFGKNGISVHRLVYHAHTLFQEVEGSHGERGAPFIDEWAVYENGTLTGRSDGWLGVRMRVRNNARVRTTEQGALCEARKQLVQKKKALEEEIGFLCDREKEINDRLHEIYLSER